MTLGSRVTARRKELGMTQEELAKKMGYQSRSSINKVECGREVSQRIIVRLAEALDVSVPYLMGWERSPEQQAEFEASILMDDDLMELIDVYRKLNIEQKAAVKQMAKMLSKS